MRISKELLSAFEFAATTSDRAESWLLAMKRSENTLAVVDEKDVNKIADYFDISATEPTSKISYILRSRLSRFEDNHFDAELRKKFAARASVAKVLTMMLAQYKFDTGGYDSEASINKLAELLVQVLQMRYAPKDEHVVIEPISNVQDVYHSDFYADPNDWGSGTLHESCMRYEAAQEYLDFYKLFDCELLVYRTDDGFVAGRAIIWNNLKLKNNGVETTERMCDRIYYCNDTVRNAMLRYCIDNKLIYRDNQSTAYRLLIGDKAYQPSEVSLYAYPLTGHGIALHTNHDMQFPYMDTLRTLCQSVQRGECYLSNYAPDETMKFTYADLTSTEGSFSLRNHERVFAFVGDRLERCRLCDVVEAIVDNVGTIGYTTDTVKIGDVRYSRHICYYDVTKGTYSTSIPEGYVELNVEKQIAPADMVVDCLHMDGSISKEVTTNCTKTHVNGKDIYHSPRLNFFFKSLNTILS